MCHGIKCFPVVGRESGCRRRPRERRTVAKATTLPQGRMRREKKRRKRRASLKRSWSKRRNGGEEHHRWIQRKTRGKVITPLSLLLAAAVLLALIRFRKTLRSPHSPWPLPFSPCRVFRLLQSVRCHAFPSPTPLLR